MSAVDLTSPFLPDALAALGARRLTVLDGAVDDDVLVHGRRCSVADALAGSWVGVTDALAVRWGAGGLDCEDPARLRDLLSASSSPHDLGAALGEDPLAVRDPLDVLGVVRRLLEQDRQRVLVLAEHADLQLATGPDPYSRRVTASLLEAIEAHERTDELHALVLLVRDLGTLPRPVLQRPGVAQLRIAVPDAAARAHVLADAFGRSGDDAEVARLALAADGMRLRELARLPDHGRTTGLGTDRPQELVASFRHGHRVDPWASLDGPRMREVRAAVAQQVVGQERAVADVLDRLEVACSGLDLDPPTSGTRKSRMELFLVGPTGVGKNELARALAKALFGDPGAVLTIDMSTLQQEHSGEQLFGAQPGYVGSDQERPIMRHLRERPFSVIVFDEIEKAHPNNWLRLMAAIDEGRVTDTRGVTASLEDAIVIFTSNIGGDVLLDEARRRTLGPADVERLTRTLVEQHLTRQQYATPDGDVRTGLGRPEVWGRMQASLVAFDLLREEALERIVGRFAATLASSAERNRDLELIVDVPGVTAVVAGRLGQPGTWNGRLVRGELDALVRRPLARALAADRHAGARTLRLTLDADGALLLR